jgi:hypothetical protein
MTAGGRREVRGAGPGSVENWSDLDVVVGLAAILFPIIYFVADLIETAQGNFSTARLVLAYIAESAIPLFVLGLYATQRPRIGRLGLFGAVGYAYSFVFFTSTVVYALTAHLSNWKAVTHVFGGWFILAGAIMVIGGAAFGLASIKAEVLPRWTGMVLIIGVVLVAATAGMSNGVRTAAAALPDAAFVGMGLALLRRHSRATSCQ